MPDEETAAADPSILKRTAVARWDNEGGAGPCGPQLSAATNPSTDIPEMSNADIVQLRIRVIALENLVVALLAEGSDRQRKLVRDMAGFITPRPGFTQHPLTIRAADGMIHLVERAEHFRK